MGTDDADQALRREQGLRLQLARGRFYPKAADAWRANRSRFGGNLPTTYQQHENGTRGMGRMAGVYADVYDVPFEWLLRGDNPPDWAVGGELTPEERAGGASNHLRPWRLRAGLTEDDLAARLGVPVDIVQRWESGQLDLSAKRLRRLAEVLNATPGLLLDVDPDAVPPAVLETWLQQVGQQQRVREQVAALRTGTGG